MSLSKCTSEGFKVGTGFCAALPGVAPSGASCFRCGKGEMSDGDAEEVKIYPYTTRNRKWSTVSDDSSPSHHDCDP